MKKSLGLIETIGLTAGIVAADTAVKSANVELVGYELTKGAGMMVIKLEGDVGAVTAAVASAASAASAVGKVISTKVIPRPAEGLEIMTANKDTIGCKGDTSIEENTLLGREVNEKEASEENVPVDEVINDEENSDEVIQLGTDIIEEDTSVDNEDNEEEDSEEIIQEETILDEDNMKEKVNNPSEKDIKISQVSKKKGSTKKGGQKNTMKGSKSNKDDQ